MNKYELFDAIEETDEILCSLENEMREQGVDEETLTDYAKYAMLQVLQLVKFNDDKTVDEFIENVKERL